MPTFHYEAMDNTGLEVKETVEAPTEAEKRGARATAANGGSGGSTGAKVYTNEDLQKLATGTPIDVMFKPSDAPAPAEPSAEAGAPAKADETGSEPGAKTQDPVGWLEQRQTDSQRRKQQVAEAQEQLYHSQTLASIGRLAAGVAHEINNPLTGVLTFSSFLVKRMQDNPEVRKDLETIVRETKRCRRIVKGLLDFSKQVPVRKANINLGDVIARAMSIVESRLSLDNISVSRQLSDDLPLVTADPDQLLQVFINLLVNAADAIGGEGGEISIHAQPRKANGRSEVEIIVTDSGCGIPSEEIGKVFEPFYTTKDREGTGLGLAVVWGIIDKHGGAVDLTSEVGVGTTVTLRLPVGRRSAGTAQEVA